MRRHMVKFGGKRKGALRLGKFDIRFKKNTHKYGTDYGDIQQVQIPGPQGPQGEKGDPFTYEWGNDEFAETGFYKVGITT